MTQIWSFQVFFLRYIFDAQPLRTLRLQTFKKRNFDTIFRENFFFRIIVIMSVFLTENERWLRMLALKS